MPVDHSGPGWAAAESVDADDVEAADAGGAETAEGAETAGGAETSGAAGTPGGSGEDSEGAEFDLEVDLDELSPVEAEAGMAAAVVAVTRQRDDYLDALRRLQADFENYKKRIVKQQAEIGERAAGALIEKLLPVLDTTDLAIAHGAGEGVGQIAEALTSALEREGLERIDTAGAPFDPHLHDAVAHEAGDGDGDGGQQVAEVLRAGYRWKGRVIRAAMVKVRG